MNFVYVLPMFCCVVPTFYWAIQLKVLPKMECHGNRGTTDTFTSGTIFDQLVTL